MKRDQRNANRYNWNVLIGKRGRRKISEDKEDERIRIMVIHG